jgi:hypothetical protein B2_05335
MRLVDTRLMEIVRREQDNINSIHLYGTGEYWAGFEQSAYLLCRLFKAPAISVLTHPDYPFPVVMASIPDSELNAYVRRHPLKHDDAEYKQLIATEISAAQYSRWHRNEIQQFL